LAKIKQITLNPKNIKKKLPNGIVPLGISSSSTIVTITVFEIEFLLSSVKVMLYIDSKNFYKIIKNRIKGF